MKKVYILFALNTLFFNVVFAQFKWGAGGGPHNTRVIENNQIQNWDQEYKGHFTPLGGFHAGIFSEINLTKNSNWALQPALLYTNKGRKFSKSFDSTQSFNNDTSTINASWKVNYLELPVNLVYRFPLSQKVRFVLGGGPYVAFQLNGKTKYEIINASGERETFGDKMATGDAVNKYQKLNWGVNALAGFDFNDRVMITANYSRSLSNFYNAGYEGSFKHQVWGGTVVIWLTPSKSARVKASERDTDGDGVPDKADKCAGEMGTAATNGCPDRDGDGTPDNEDKCPDLTGANSLLGCPAPDKDKDGIADSEDDCPDVPGTAAYKGCPVPDSDKDGISDDKDNCPGISGKARYNGCPAPDTDGDGIDDDTDKCPLKAGSKDNNGCPGIGKDMLDDINKAARSVLFDVNSDNIKASSFGALDKLAEILRRDAELKLEIEGHTDNTGSVRLNQVLSGRRALAIKAYLVKQGINAERLTSAGFGSERPIASNDTEAGRAKNRRVAFKVKY